ncbi:MAG: hypothetical protein LBH54_06220 [Clostridiales bacterium]|nr:hypothetical protein [Clostridiales bacterium]
MAVFCAIIFTAPLLGVANQNDFSRVMYGMRYDDWTYYYQNLFSKHLQLEYPFTPFPHGRLFGFPPAVSEIYFIYAARILSKLFGFAKFQLPIYAALTGTVYVGALSFLYRVVLPRKKPLRILVGVILLLIFLDGYTVMWFNSLYGEPIVFIGIILTAASFLFAARRNSPRYSYVLFAVSSLIMIGGKLQAIELFAAAAPLALYLLARAVKKRGIFKIVTLAVLFPVSVGYCWSLYSELGGDMNNQTTYQSVMTGLLPNAEHPGASLAELGLAQGFIADIGKNVYLDSSEYSYAAPFTEEWNQEFYAQISNEKIVKYYLKHMDEFVKGLEYLGRNSLSHGRNVGEDSRQLGLHTIAHPHTTNHNRFLLYSAFLNLLPKSFWFLLAILLLNAALSLFLIVKKQVRAAVLILSLCLGGSLQFVMPYVFNGSCDTAKQLLIFGFLFDLLIFGLLRFGAPYLLPRPRPRRKRKPVCERIPAEQAPSRKPRERLGTYS